VIEADLSDRHNPEFDVRNRRDPYAPLKSRLSLQSATTQLTRIRVTIGEVSRTAGVERKGGFQNNRKLHHRLVDTRDNSNDVVSWRDETSSTQTSSR
jgi:hypothetical protein